ncbi:TolB family protein [candidate division KSB1 bacterium]
MRGIYLLLILINSIVISCSSITDLEQSVDDHLKIAYVNYLDPPGIYVMNRDSSECKRVTDTCSDYYPSWSPDGTKIVYGNLYNGIFVVNIETSDNVLLSDTGKYPSWSPDGSKIAYHLIESNMTSICIMDPDGTNNVSLITIPGWFCTYKWSPDGSKIAYMSRKIIDDLEQWDLNIISIYNGSAPRIIEADFINDIAWSPVIYD